MTLFGIRGEAKAVNEYLLEHSIRTPSIIVDTANSANLYLLPYATEPELLKTYVVEAESLYRYKAIIKELHHLLEKHNTNTVFIFAFRGLFAFSNPHEDTYVLNDCWKTLVQLSHSHDIYIGIQESSVSDLIAQQHEVNITTMGHTLPSQRMVTDIILAELQEYAKALREEDRAIYTQMLKKPLLHLGSISQASSMHTWALLLLSIQLEQEKRLQKLENGTRLDT